MTLTQNFDFYRLAAIKLGHTLNLREGDKVSTLKAMTCLIQTCHNTLIVLVKPNEQHLTRQKSNYVVLFIYF